MIRLVVLLGLIVAGLLVTSLVIGPAPVGTVDALRALIWGDDGATRW